jgi:hypothetical protein
MRCDALILAVALAACSEGKSAAPGSDPKGTVKGFLDALIAGDVAQARGFLPDEAACEKAPSEVVERCKQSVEPLRERIPELVADLPKGTKVISIEKSDEPIPVPDAAIWIVELETDGERDDVELFTLKLGDRYYAGFPFKVASKDE